MILHLLRDILTRQSFLNAIAVVNAIGGSTNAVNFLWIQIVHSTDAFVS